MIISPAVHLPPRGRCIGAITIERECAGDKAKEDILAGKKLIDGIIESL